MPEELEEVSPVQYEVIKAVLGQDAETFRATKLGQYIYGRVSNEEEQLVEDLIKMSLTSSDLRIVRGAMDIQMHRMLPKFIDEAVQSGRSATQNIDQMESSQRDY
jgi:hypothetical protein